MQLIQCLCKGFDTNHQQIGRSALVQGVCFSFWNLDHIVSYETYEEWAARKTSENPKEWEIYMKKGRNYSADKSSTMNIELFWGTKSPIALTVFNG